MHNSIIQSCILIFCSEQLKQFHFKFYNYVFRVLSLITELFKRSNMLWTSKFERVVTCGKKFVVNIKN